jgi:hypothetical protein
MTTGRPLHSVEGLAELRQMARAGFGLGELAAHFGESSREVNVALNALLGRTPAAALLALDRSLGQRALTQAVRRTDRMRIGARFKAFLQELFT